MIIAEIPKAKHCSFFCYLLTIDVCIINVWGYTEILPILGSFSNDDGDGDGNQAVKKATGLLRNTTTLHVRHDFLYIFFTVLARLRRENA